MECVINVDLCKILVNVNVNVNVENVRNVEKGNCEFGDLCNGIICEYDCGVLLTPEPTPATAFDFINSRTVLREQFDFEYIFGFNNNGSNGIDRTNRGM